MYTMKAKNEKHPATSESTSVCAVLILVSKKPDLVKVLMINSSEQKN